MSPHRDAFVSGAIGFALTTLVWAPVLVLEHIEKAERIADYEQSASWNSPAPALSGDE
jgi:hypothetical protein